MNYIDYLNNEKVIKAYKKIDEINDFPFNHGLKHVKNVCEIMNNICNILGITKEKEALLIASALHDVGQIYGRENHGLKSKQYIIKNFNEDLKKNEYYNDILEAIEKHSDPDINNSLFCTLLSFADKMDFTKKRLEDDYRDKFNYCISEEIEDFEFINTNEEFGINIITKEDNDFENRYINSNIIKKTKENISVLAQKLGKKPIIQHNGKEMNIW